MYDKQRYVEVRKLEVKFNKPIYVSSVHSTYQKSACYCYELHHEYMSPIYRDKCKIMSNTPDSFIYYIECDDAHETIRHNIARFDTSDYPANNMYDMSLANKNVSGLMKNKNNGVSYQITMRKHRQATYRRNSRDLRKTFEYDVQRDKDRWSGKMQKWAI